MRLLSKITLWRSLRVVVPAIVAAAFLACAPASHARTTAHHASTGTSLVNQGDVLLIESSVGVFARSTDSAALDPDDACPTPSHYDHGQRAPYCMGPGCCVAASAAVTASAEPFPDFTSPSILVAPPASFLRGISAAPTDPPPRSTLS